MLIKRFECDCCGKKFERKPHLLDHLNVHFGRHLSCPLCRKSYSNRANLLRHIRILHFKVGFTCSVCDKPYQRAYQLKQHLQAKHQAVASKKSAVKSDFQPIIKNRFAKGCKPISYEDLPLEEECGCSPDDVLPCNFEDKCLNAMLQLEGPAVCGGGDRFNNKMLTNASPTAAADNIEVSNLNFNLYGINSAMI